MIMKKVVLFLVIMLTVISVTYSQDIECIYCGENRLGITSSAIGEGNENLGDFSLTIGNGNLIGKNLQVVTLIGVENIVNYNGLGNYSGAFGFKNIIRSDKSFAFGIQDTVSATGSIAIGTGTAVSGLHAVGIGLNTKVHGNYSVAIGNRANSMKMNSYSFGNNVWSDAQGSITIGSSHIYLKNTISYSLMVGFKSNLPTFFVSSSDGAGTTGKIGIGNVTDPQAKLHIKADAGEDAAMLITPDTWGGNEWAELRLGNNNNGVSAHNGQGLIFKTENSYLFNSAGARFGIGVENPSAKLDINGNIHQSSGFHISSSQIQAHDNGNLSLTDHDGNGIFVEDGGNVVIGKISQNKNLDVIGHLKTKSLQIPELNPDGSPESIEGYVLLSNDNLGNARWVSQSSIDDGDWTKDEGNIYRIDGQVGIGTATYDPAIKLDVLGKVRMTDFQLDNSDPGEGKILQSDANGNASWVAPDDGDWTIDENENIFRINGNVRIGNVTIDPEAKLDVGGKVKVQEFQLLSGAPGLDKLLRSDEYGNATWADPPPTDDGDWVVSGDNVFRDGGKVGIGTSGPTANLHIKDPSGDSDSDKTFFRVENIGEFGCGKTEIGRWGGNGPVILQKAGSVTFDSVGPRLTFRQIPFDETGGFSISTYTTVNGKFDKSDIFAEIGTLFIRAKDNLNFRTETGNGSISFATDGLKQRMQINSQGQVGIGTTNHDGTDTKLTVAGTIHAQEVKVTAGAGGADFVFENDYDLPGIAEVESFIKTNKHLPGIPSADEMITNGIDVGEMQIKLLQKIEELTLYVIELKKENEVMRGDNEEMKVEIENLKRR